jgi:hypothetical protein
MKLSFLFLLIAFFSAGETARADALLTYEGQIIDPSNNPLEGSSVVFRTKIFNQAKTCLLWQESQTINMSGSGGNFKLNIGGGPNTATATTDFRQIFSNSNTQNCNGGTTYNPSVNEQRTMLLEFDDDADNVYVIIDEIPVNFSPYAFHAITVGGYSSSYLFKSDTSFSSVFPGTGVQEIYDFATKTNLNASISSLTGPTPFGDGTNVPVVTVDAFGRITNVTTTPISISASELAAGSVTNAKLGSNSVTSDKISDGTIVNADIASTAGILDTKLATISTAGKVANSATTATAANTASAIVARDGSGNFAAGRVSSTELRLDNGTGGLISIFSPSGALTYSMNLPPNMGAPGQFLQTDGSTQVSWVTIVGLPSCVSNQIAYFDGTNWVCKTWATAATAGAMVARDGSGNSDFNQVNVKSVSIDHNSGGSAVIRGATSGSSYTMRLPSAGPSANGDALVLSSVAGQLTWSSSAQQRLKVGGQAVTTSYNFTNSTTLDFDNGNIQYSSTLTSCALTLNNMQDGTVYTLILDSISTSVTCSFTVSGVSTYQFAPSNRATVAGTTSIYRLTKIGSKVFVDWTTGVQ